MSRRRCAPGRRRAGARADRRPRRPVAGVTVGPDAHRSDGVACSLVLGLLALPFVAAAGWFWYQLDPIGDPGAPVALTIPKGEGVGGIGDRLEEHGVIGSSLAFSVYAPAQRLAAIPGRALPAPARPRGPQRGRRARARSDPALHDAWRCRPGSRSRRSRRASARCRDATPRARPSSRPPVGCGRSSSRPARTRSRGSRGPTRTRSRTTRTRPTSCGPSSARSTATPPRPACPARPIPYRTVIVASLIQREAGVDEDRPLIAAVVENRLRQGMPLQIDATVLYARGWRPVRSRTPTSPATRRTTPTRCTGCRRRRSRPWASRR